MPEARIVIVGGGASGLTTAGALKQYGIDSVILDNSAQTGDIWRKRYERLKLHTIRGLSHMAYHQMPADLPRYVPKDQFAQYMAEYAQHFKLDIRHNIQVTGIRKAIDGWRISTEEGETWVSEHVIIATGFNRVPHLPHWEGQDAYGGTLLHAVEYQTGRTYSGKRVLVIGSGNTATEICVDLLEQGVKEITVSVHSFPTIVPRDPFGVPIQVWGLILFPLPRAIKDAIVNLVARLQLGDLSRYGFQKPEWRVFGDGRIPTIDVGFVDALKQGKIKVAGKIQNFTAQGVTFADGSSHEFDAVIAATGYRTGLQDLLEIPDVINADGSLQVACGEPNHHAGLWFVGLENSPAGLLLAARVQSRKLAKHIARQLGIKA